MKNKKSFRKYGVTCLCVFAGVSLSTNAFGNVVFATEFVAPNVVNNTSMQSELKNTIENQPISSYWYPDTLLKWSAEMDEDAVFNKSLITLAKRVDKDKLVTVNDTQNKDVKVVAISIMNANTSGNPSQGSNKFSANTFSYWQYIDTLVYWGGSAGEGLIVPPSPDVTDAAHRNGVPVLGTIFFPQTEHGGKMEWLNTFLQKDNQGNFPMVDKLIEVLEAYHFDGWFINQETQGTEKDPLTVEHAQLMQEFIKQFKTKVGDKYQMMWYDSMTKEGKMHWQNALTDKNDYFLIDDAKNPVADSMFLNFGWIYNAYKDLDLLNASNQKAKELGINPYDLYAGIDVQANGYNTGVRWTHFQRDDQVPFTSLGLYCPSWTYFNASTPTEFQDNEARLWVNEFADPTKKTQAQGYEWRGISTYAVEKSAVTTLPFVTNFSLGNGYDFYRYGQKVSTQDWNNRSLNDIMPTYRWMIKQQEGTELLAAIDYTTAYYAGNSIKLSGVLAKDAPATIKLYQADVTIPVGAVYKTTAKATSQVQLDLVLTFDDGEEAIISGNQVLGNDWTTVNYDISAYVGKAIQTIAYQITGSQDVDDFTANMGNITLEVPGSSSLVNTENLKVADVDFKDGIYAGVRLAWNSADSDVQHFEIYRVMADGSKVLLGATPNTHFYVSGLRRANKETTTKFEVVAVNKEYKRGSASTIEMVWPEYPAPTPNFIVSNTMIAPGESVTFTNMSSEVTEEVEWYFPGATVETTTEENPSVTYEKEGVYPVTLVAKNTSGANFEVKKELITVTKEASKGLENLSQGKTAVASSYVNDNEAPQFALDGNVKTKWCAVGDAPHSLTIDLGDVRTIGELEIAHAEAGGESSGMNSKEYTLEVSMDGKNFTEVLHVTDNTRATSQDAIPVIKAKYVRLTLVKPTQGADQAARIYEVRVNGVNNDITLPEVVEPVIPQLPEIPDIDGGDDTITPKPEPEKPSKQRGWIKENGNWFYYKEDGQKAIGWLPEGKNWYFFNEKAEMQTGWLKDSSNWYYLKDNGQMARGWEVINGTYYLFKDWGGMAQGEWMPVGEDWFYIHSDGTYAHDEWVGSFYLKQYGQMAYNEWIYDNHYQSWFYINEDGTYAHDTWNGAYYLKQWGHMAHNEWIYDNHYQSWFFINEDGSYAQNQWVGAYYLKDWGYMAHNEWIYDNHYQSWFFINEDGSYAQNQWVGAYYLKDWGYMAHNEWIYDKGHWYYLKDNGQMARNEVINSYKVDASGKWKK